MVSKHAGDCFLSHKITNSKKPKIFQNEQVSHWLLKTTSISAGEKEVQPYEFYKVTWQSCIQTLLLSLLPAMILPMQKR